MPTAGLLWVHAYFSASVNCCTCQPTQSSCHQRNDLVILWNLKCVRNVHLGISVYTEGRARHNYQVASTCGVIYRGCHSKILMLLV